MVISKFNVQKYYRDLSIRHKLLLGYAAFFVFFLLLSFMLLYPLIRRTLESDIEGNLNNSTKMISNTVRVTADASIKNYLRAVAEKNKNIVAEIYYDYKQGKFSEEEAKKRAKSILLSQHLGKTGYIYCLDSHGIIQVHPVTTLLGADLTKYDFIKKQLKDKTGYIEYDWKNPGESKKRPKALYMTYFEPWDWIISASSYREEFNELVNVDNFRDSILSIRFGKTGYPYIMTSKGMLILHPYLHGDIYNVKDSDGRYFIREMCRQKSGRIIYSWANPGENKPRKKLVIFNYIPEFDWIVGSSGYEEEFYEPLIHIRNIFLTVCIAALIVLFLLTLRFSYYIVDNLNKLIRGFQSGSTGDLTIRMPKSSLDEFGKLTDGFNNFMDKLEASISKRKQAEKILLTTMVSRDSLIKEVDERKHAEEAMQKSKEEAERANKAKSDFLANMSHEIRTPLNAILGFSDLLRSTSVDDKQKEYLNTITTSSDILLSIINDILDFSKLEAGKVQLESIDFDLGNLVNDVFNMTQIRFQDQTIESYIDWDVRVPHWVKGDPTRIRQILLNFLNNAAKFTQHGSIGVIIRLEQETPQGPVVQFCVKDSGIGIPEDKKHFLFESFSQVDSSTTRRYGGTGLGLVICKKLVDAMGGKVWFESQEGQGSQFFFTVPFALGTSMIDQAIDPLSKAQLLDKTVLCVDDYKGSLEIVARYCAEMGLKVIKASSAEEALQKLNACTPEGMPDLMLSDVRMPDMDGYIMVEKIRSNPKYEAMKIVATTSDVRIGGAAFAQKKGFNAYLPKPVTRQDLHKVISTVLGDRRSVPASIITRHMANEVSLKGIRVLVVDDVFSNQQLMKAYLGMFGCISEFADNGQEAIDKIKVGSYHICLMDVQMPVLDGIEATKIIRAGISQGLPIIALTAAVMKEDLTKTQAAGMNDFLTKPLEINKLKSMLLKFI